MRPPIRSFWPPCGGFATTSCDFRRRILPARRAIDRPAAAAICGSAIVPLRRVGICVPGGAAAYPSTVLMTAVPAQAAGVERAGDRRPADAVRGLQSRSAGHLP